MAVRLFYRVSHVFSSEASLFDIYPYLAIQRDTPGTPTFKMAGIPRMGIPLYF